MADAGKSVPGLTGKCFPEVFDIRAMPPPIANKKPGQLSNEMIESFFKDGYVVVEDFFDIEKELNPVREAINGYVDKVAKRLYKAGKISDMHEDCGFRDRLVKLEEDFPGANILCFKQMGSVPQALKDLWANERLLNVVEQLIGPDIAGNPVWNLRTKTPRNNATTVPWHQDNGYTDNDTYSMLIPTAWIPFLDTDADNGCMQFIKGGHLSGKVARHTCCWKDTWYVMLEEAEMEQSLGVDVKTQLRTVPVPYGGMVLFNNLIPHRSLDNQSDHVRWSVDLRWQRPTCPSGLYGLKEKVVMRLARDPNHPIDWASFDGVNRHVVQRGSMLDEVKVEQDDLDTTVQGPWMKKWEITHTNRHTDAFMKA